MLGVSELSTVLQVEFHKGRKEGESHSLLLAPEGAPPVICASPPPVSYVSFDAALDNDCPLGLEAYFAGSSFILFYFIFLHAPAPRCPSFSEKPNTEHSI